MIKSEQLQIAVLSNKRKDFLRVWQNSWNEERGDYEMKEPKEIDKLGEEIYSLLRKWKEFLTFEFIFEELASLGQCPCFLNDDNGHWAVTSDGYQEIAKDDKPQDLETHFLVEAKYWKNTPREALYYYLDQE